MSRDTEAFVSRLVAALAPVGLNLVGAASIARYDRSVPAGYRLGDAAVSAVVLGHGGGAFWEACRSHGQMATQTDPVDVFTTYVMTEIALPVATACGVRASLRLPFETEGPPLSFVHLAEAAGLGVRSVLGILVHPEYGPWMALRGALLLDVDVTAPRPAAGFDPCPQCTERPCLAACPGGVVSYPAGWDVPGCARFRVAHEDECASQCHARVACVYGRGHRYPVAALAHHQARALAAMRSRAG